MNADVAKCEPENRLHITVHMPATGLTHSRCFGLAHSAATRLAGERNRRPIGSPDFETNVETRVAYFTFATEPMDEPC